MREKKIKDRQRIIQQKDQLVYKLVNLLSCVTCRKKVDFEDKHEERRLTSQWEKSNGDIEIYHQMEKEF